MDIENYHILTSKEITEDSKKFYFKELDYLMDRLKWYENLRSNTLVFSGTASLTIIGISISNNQPVFMVVPIVILLFFIYFDRRCRKSVLSFYCCVHIVLDNLKIIDQDTIFHINTTPLSEEARRIITDYSTLKDRKQAIKNTKIVNKGFFFFLPIVILILEITGSSIWVLVHLITWIMETNLIIFPYTLSR